MTVRKDLLLTLDRFEDSDLVFVPVEGGLRVGRIMVHISGAANYWLHSGVLSPINVYRQGENTLENYPTLDAIRGCLAEENNRTIQLLEDFEVENLESEYQYPDGFSYKPSWIFWHVLESEIHHRGSFL